MEELAVEEEMAGQVPVRALPPEIRALQVRLPVLLVVPEVEAVPITILEILVVTEVLEEEVLLEIPVTQEPPETLDLQAT